MTRAFNFLRSIFGLMLLVVGHSLAIAADPAWNVDRLNDFKDDRGDWDRLIGETIRVEGRVSSVGKTTLRLAKCTLGFQFTEEQAKVLANVKAIELSGKVQKDSVSGRIICVVNTHRVLPTDAEEFRRRMAGFLKPEPKDYYELGQWIRERGKLYKDDESEKLALSAFEKGAELEYAQSRKSTENLRALAKSLQNLGVSGPRIGTLQFEAYLLESQSLQSANPPPPQDAWLRLAKRFREEFPGCDKELAQPFPDWVKGYREQPLEMYQKAEMNRRLPMHRLFYADHMRRYVLAEALPEGRNGKLIAEKLMALASEFKEEAEQFRIQYDEYRLNRVATSTRADVQLLAVEFQERGQPEKGRSILKTWIEAREKQYRANGVQGLLQLSDEYRTLLNDEPQTVQLLVEAWKLDPNQPEAADRLKQLGYVLKEGRWSSSAGTAIQPPEAVKPADSAVLAIGITASQVKQLLGVPAQSATVLSADGNLQIWYYGKPGTSRLVIHLVKGTHSPEAKVISFANQK